MDKVYFINVFAHLPGANKAVFNKYPLRFTEIITPEFVPPFQAVTRTPPTSRGQQWTEGMPLHSSFVETIHSDLLAVFHAPDLKLSSSQAENMRSCFTNAFKSQVIIKPHVVPKPDS